MLRSKIWFVLALLAASAGVSSACTRMDATGPSVDQPSFERQGGGH